MPEADTPFSLQKRLNRPLSVEAQTYFITNSRIFSIPPVISGEIFGEISDGANPDIDY
ncbi:MAG: hypothetical protein IJJ33_10675 [Victivallales bacterium]|nr:hypothetical protein [Victivallales bacterium]